MRLSKIYTKTGDQGSTRLADGSKIPKNHARLDAYGTVDELNACVGCLRDAVAEQNRLSHLDQQLAKIQNELFDIGGEFASPDSFVQQRLEALISEQDVLRLEQEMDKYNEDLQPLQNFVLPGGHQANSLAHLCRTVCRRAERSAISLRDLESIRLVPVKYLNRLSDWFFIVSRHISQTLELKEVIWSQKKP